jgi:hypothetical protein
VTSIELGVRDPGGEADGVANMHLSAFI